MTFSTKNTYIPNWKVRGLTLLLRVGTLWKYGDGLLFEVPPIASYVLLITTLHPLFENVLQTVDHFEISRLGAPFSRLEKPRKNRMGRARSELYGGCCNGVPPIHFFQAEHWIQFRSRPMQFLGFSNYEKGAPRQEISKWSTVCSTFSRSRWRILRNASLAKGGTSKKRPSPHLHKVSTRSNKVSPWNLQTALVLGLTVPRTWTDELTKWSRVAIEKLIVSQLVKKFPTFYVTRRFTAVFTRPSQWNLYWVR
jgi:hypothetical protein